MPKIVLGFDFGMKHIGVAIGQSITKTASPLTTLSAKDGIPNWVDIQLLIQEWKPDALIVGLPYQNDGSPQLMTFCAKRFMNRLRTRFKLPIHAVDEQLSTWEAKHRASEKYVKHKKKYSDKEIHSHAAVILVEQWLEMGSDLEV